MRTRGIAARGIGVAVAALALGCGLERSGAGSGAGRAALPVHVETVAGDSGTAGLVVSGIVEARGGRTLGFPVAGRIARYRAEVGAVVEAGAVIAELTRAPLLRAVTAARAASERARARLEEVERRSARRRGLLELAAVAAAPPEADGIALALHAAEVRQARAVLDAAEERLASAVLQAPAAGVVARRYGIAGARVAAGDPVVELLEIERVAVRGGVPRALASLLRDGGSVSVRAAGEPSAPPRSGTLRRLAGEAPAADGTVGFEVWVENADRRLRPQMLVEIAVDVPVAPVRFSVPLSALRRGIADEPFVFVVVGAEGAARVERRVLTLAGLRRDRVAVVAGVRDGDRVVVRGARLLTVGDVVDVVGEGP